MALQVSGGISFSLFRDSVTHNRIRAVTSGYFVTVKTEGEDKVKLGGSDFKVKKLGIGAWSWGDTSYWNNFEWDDTKLKAAKTAFDVSVDSGITFFDTAEVYGSKVQLQHRIKQEAEQFRQWKASREKEMLQIDVLEVEGVYYASRVATDMKLTSALDFPQSVVKYVVEQKKL